MGYLEGCKQTSLLLDSTFSTFITSDLNGKKLFYFFSGECAYSVLGVLSPKYFLTHGPRSYSLWSINNSIKRFHYERYTYEDV
jgi:hypothetical protein